jgi:antitoxin ParD1/3/4
MVRDARALGRVSNPPLQARSSPARIGFDALDRAEFKEFAVPDELQVYLNDLSEKVISRTGK